MHEPAHELAARFPRQIFQPEVDARRERREVRDPRFDLVSLNLKARSVTSLRASKDPLAVRGLTEHRLDLGVLNPLVKVALSGSQRLPKSPAFPLVVLGARRNRALEPFVDELGDVLVKDVRADTHPVLARHRGTPVRHEPLRVHGARQNVPAVRAPSDVRAHPVVVLDRVVDDVLHMVRRIPLRLRDKWGPCVLDSHTAHPAEHPEIRFIADDPEQGAVVPLHAARWGWDPGVLEFVGDLTPPGSLGAARVDQPDDLRFIGHDTSGAIGGFLVPVRWAPRVPALSGCSSLRRGEVFVGLVALPLSHQKDEAEHRTAHRGCGIDVLVDADDPRALLVEFADGDESTDECAREPVDASDDDALGFAGVDALSERVESGPVHCAAGLVEVLVVLGDSYPVELRPLRDRFALLGGGLEAFAGPAADDADADVPVHDGCGGGHPAYRIACRYLPICVGPRGYARTSQ